MNKNAHFNPKSNKWVVNFAIMVVISVAMIFGTVFVAQAVTEKNSQTAKLAFDYNMSIPVAVKENEAGITSVEKAMDSQNNIIGYIVKQSVTGYNQEVPIEMETKFVLDGDKLVVYSVDILKQEETEYLGVRIAGADFKDQFQGKTLPLKDAKSVLKGSNVDLIAGSTISSQAVVDGVNGAGEYVEALVQQ